MNGTEIAQDVSGEVREFVAGCDRLRDAETRARLEADAAYHRLIAAKRTAAEESATALIDGTPKPNARALLEAEQSFNATRATWLAVRRRLYEHENVTVIRGLEAALCPARDEYNAQAIASFHERTAAVVAAYRQALCEASALADALGVDTTDVLTAPDPAPWQVSSDASTINLENRELLDLSRHLATTGNRAVSRRPVPALNGWRYEVVRGAGVDVGTAKFPRGSIVSRGQIGDEVIGALLDHAEQILRPLSVDEDAETSAAEVAA